MMVARRPWCPSRKVSAPGGSWRARGRLRCRDHARGGRLGGGISHHPTTAPTAVTTSTGSERPRRHLGPAHEATASAVDLKEALRQQILGVREVARPAPQVGEQPRGERVIEPFEGCGGAGHGVLFHCIVGRHPRLDDRRRQRLGLVTLGSWRQPSGNLPASSEKIASEPFGLRQVPERVVKGDLRVFVGEVTWTEGARLGERAIDPQRWIDALKDAVQSAERTGLVPSLFDVMGLYGSERHHNRALAWLVSADADHGAGRAVLLAIARGLGCKELEADLADFKSPITVRSEMRWPEGAGSSREPDLLVLSPRALLLIENKVSSGEGSRQYEEYHEASLRRSGRTRS